MSPEIIRWIVGLAVLGHGLGHVLFMPVLSGAMNVDATGRSWLLSGVLGDDLTRLIASVVAGGLLAAFVIVAGGIVAQTTWWRPLAVAASIGSIVLVTAMWGGLLGGPALSAIAFDAIVLVALLALDWPSRDTIGA